MGAGQFGDQYARAANVKVHVEAVLARSTLLIRSMVLMVDSKAMVIMAVIKMCVMDVTFLIFIVGMNEKAREDTRSDCIGHADGRRECERQDDGPSEGRVASAYSFQVDQHVLWLAERSSNMSVASLGLKRKFGLLNFPAKLKLQFWRPDGHVRPSHRTSA